jgi:hypothetical protein
MAAAIAAAFSAHATGKHAPQPAKPNAVSTATAAASSRSTSAAAARANGGSARATGGDATASGGQGGSASGTGGQGVGTVDVSNTTRVRPPAYAPSVHPTANCAMGASVGIGGVLSAGGSHIDENCATIEQAKAIADLGDPFSAQEVLCSLPRVREARVRSGNPCWADKPENAPKANEPTDPYVRKRLGLPAL